MVEEIPIRFFDARFVGISLHGSSLEVGEVKHCSNVKLGAKSSLRSHRIGLLETVSGALIVVAYCPWIVEMDISCRDTC